MRIFVAVVVVATLGSIGCFPEEEPDVGESTQASIGSNELVGYQDKFTRVDNNRCLPDVVGALIGMRRQGELMGFREGDGHPDLCDVPPCFHEYHVQGMSRFAPITTGATTDYSLTDYFVMTSNHEEGSRFAIVRMGSGPNNGLRIKGTKSAVGNPDWDNPPKTNDNMIISQIVDPEHEHPGGVNVLGRYFVTGVERPIPLFLDRPGRMVMHYMPTTLDPATCGSGGGPSCPQKRWSLDLDDSCDCAAFATGLKVKASNETAHRYLWITANKDSRNLNLLLTAQNQSLDVSPTISSAISATPGLDWPPEMAYQNMTLVSQCEDGQLWLLGFHGDGTDDWLDAWPLEVTVVNGVIVNAEVLIRYRRLLDKRDGGHFYAGHSVYVDPVGHMLGYVTEKFDYDPALLELGIRFTEYRMNSHLAAREAPFSQSDCNTADQGFVELLDGLVGNGATLDSPNTLPQAPQPFHAFMIDYTKRNARTYSNFATAYDYNDRASSIRYCVPAGLKYVLFKDPNYVNAGFVARGALTDYVGSATAGTVSNGFIRAWNFGSNSNQFSSGCFMNASRTHVAANCCTTTCP